jgi:hypothetical protein
MPGLVRRDVIAGGLVLLGSAAWGAPPDEPLPPPRFVVPGPVVPPPSVSFIRPNPYDVWQLYGVDRSGFFRPRVVPTPYGFRYLANGAPYPWWQNYPQSFAPWIAEQANFAGTERPHYVLMVSPPPLSAPAPAMRPRMPYADE